MARRITRKQLKQDEFRSTVDTLFQWILGMWKPLAAGLGAILFIALVWWIASGWSNSRVEAASLSLDEAMRAAAESEAGMPADVPEGEDLATPEEARAKLEQVVDRFSRTTQADVARLMLARMELADEPSAEARDTLVRIAEKHRGNALGRLAQLDLIHLRVASGQATEVAQELESMVVGRDDALPRDVALFELAELYVREHREDQAKLYFQKLVDEVPESPYSSAARRRLAEIG